MNNAHMTCGRTGRNSVNPSMMAKTQLEKRSYSAFQLCFWFAVMATITIQSPEDRSPELHDSLCIKNSGLNSFDLYFRRRS